MYRLAICKYTYKDGEAVSKEDICSFDMRNDGALREVATGLIHEGYTVTIGQVPGKVDYSDSAQTQAMANSIGRPAQF